MFGFDGGHCHSLAWQMADDQLVYVFPAEQYLVKNKLTKRETKMICGHVADSLLLLHLFNIFKSSSLNLDALL